MPAEQMDPEEHKARKWRALRAERDRYRTALEEITCPPQEHPDTGEDYGCLDLHEARHIALAAITDAQEGTA